MVLKADFEIIEHNTLLTKWSKGIILLNEVKDIMEHMLLLIEKNNMIHYIDDISECEVDWVEADIWIVNDWYPRALALNVKKNALIVPDGIIMEHKDDQCEIKSFNNLEKAIIWINSSEENLSAFKLSQWINSKIKKLF